MFGKFVSIRSNVVDEQFRDVQFENLQFVLTCAFGTFQSIGERLIVLLRLVQLISTGEDIRTDDNLNDIRAIHAFDQWIDLYSW